MTIFDYLKDIIVTKKGDLLLDSYVPFLVNRWLSFINPEVCQAINAFNNKTLLEDKQMHYKTMIAMFPKMKHNPKIHYIKKIKKEEDREADWAVRAVSQTLEISMREAQQLFVEHQNISAK